MPFYRLYTPRGILSNAEFTTSYYNYSSTAITFNGGSSDYQRLFKLPLIPQELLTYSSDITVKITVGLQKAIRSHDSDPKFLLSDGTNGIGFEMRDDTYRCQGIEGTMGDVLGARSIIAGTYHKSYILPDQFDIIIKPNEDWGSCYFAADSGLISPVTYSRKFYPQRGLWLEVYAEHPSERYLFNYIIVEIRES